MEDKVSFPWQHFKVSGDPEDWEWSVAHQPGCPCNAKDDDDESQTHDCYSVIFHVTEVCTQGICRIGPGGSLPYHCHEASEMYVPLKGSCTLYINGQVKTISGDTGGEAVYIPSDCPHGLRNETDEPYEFFWVYYGRNGKKADTNMHFQEFVEQSDAESVPKPVSDVKPVSNVKPVSDVKPVSNVEPVSRPDWSRLVSGEWFSTNSSSRVLKKLLALFRVGGRV